MLTIIVNAHGETESDLLDALDEVRRSVEKGNLGGLDSNDSGGYTFAIAEREN